MFDLPSPRSPTGGLFLTATPSTPKDGPAAKARARALAADGVEVIHLLASSLRVDHSLPSAVRFAARHAGGASAEELERLEWAVRIRHFATVDEGFLAFANAVGQADGELKRALVTLLGAESESTREGLERRLDRAYDIVVRAEERRRERLASSLERPVQMVFGLAVVLPLVLASLLPMLQIAGGALGPLPTAALLVVAVPALTWAASRRLLEKNFLGARVAALHAKRAAAVALSAPAGGAIAFGAASALTGPFLPPAVWAVIGCAGAALVGGVFLARTASAGDTSRTALERDLPDMLHSIGTKMVAGRPAEHALLETVEASARSPLAERLRGVLFDVIVGRRSLADAIERDDEVRQAPRVFPALRLLAATAERDTEAAGRVVLHLSEFERLRAEAAASLRSRLKSLVETTRMTVTFFAPLILGITAGMYDLLTRIGASVVSGASAAPALGAPMFALIVALYLCLEVALADWFAARVVSERPVSDFGRSVARDVPVAMGLFAASWLASGLLF